MIPRSPVTFITDCTIKLVGLSQFFPLEKYELPDDGSELERLIATAGKVCYDSYGKDGHPVVKHVKNLVGHHHFSVIEHVSVSFFIEGISRGLSHELVRHRHFSVSQRSTRYADEADCSIVLEPYMAKLYDLLMTNQDVLTENEADILMLYMHGAGQAVESYRRLVSVLLGQAPQDLTPTEQRKWARGKARQRLPHDLETRMVLTGNLRTWREFMVKRSNRHAEAEIRRLAQKIGEQLLLIAPAAFHGLSLTHVQGYDEWTER